MSAETLQDADPHAAIVREIAPIGRLRAAVNLSNKVLAQLDPASGKPVGLCVDLAQALGQELEVPVDIVPFDAAGKVVQALADDAWDLAFLAIDPARATQMTFTPAYVLIEATYLVRTAARFKEAADLDADGVRIVAAAGAAYELHLSRNLEHAQLLREPTAALAFDRFIVEELDAMAGVRQVVDAFAKRHDGLHVLPDRFLSIGQGVAIPLGRPAAAAFLTRFLEARRADGSISRSLERSGQRDGASVPPVPSSNPSQGR